MLLIFDNIITLCPTMQYKLSNIIRNKNIKTCPHVIKTIGTRHGEKLYETLLTKEEMVKAIDMDDYYRIPADNRDLNYNKFFEEGEEIITQAGEYHSHNTHRLDEDELTNLLLGLREIQDDLERLGTCE